MRVDEVTGGVDVLAVMDEFALYVRNVSSRHALQGDIAEARAAVAELIEAAKAVADASGADTPYIERCRLRGNLRAALARCGGLQ